MALLYKTATGLDRFEASDADHGRVETRRTWVSHYVDCLRGDRAEPGLHRFPGLACIGMLEAEVEQKGQTIISRLCSVFCAPLSGVQLLRAEREHRGIKNRLQSLGHGGGLS